MNRPRTFWVGHSDAELAAFRDELRRKITDGILDAEWESHAGDVDDDLARRAHWRRVDSER